MRYELLDKPDFGMVRVGFDQPGEQLLVESSAMVARHSAIEMKTQLQGGILAAAKRKMLGGESLFQNTFRASVIGERLLLAPAVEGSIGVRTLAAGEEMFLQSGAYLASTPELTLDTGIESVRRAWAETSRAKKASAAPSAPMSSSQPSRGTRSGTRSIGSTT